MIFDQIVFQNFGIYQGTQRIELTPPDSSKPIVLIGGLNGGGKTTFLDGLQLVLFGPHAKCSNRGSLTYTEYLLRCIHRASGNIEAGIEIAFRHTLEGTEDHYHLRRYWKAAGNGCKELFEVFKNGQEEPTLADNWATQVEEFFPANIAHLFLFDGEQVEAYASQTDSAALIGAAIQNLLGLDMVDQLEKDLLVYERRKRSEGKKTTRNTEIVSAQDAVRELRNHIDALKQEQASMQVHQIDKQRRSLTKMEEKYRKIGGALYDQKDAIEGKWSDSVQKIKDGEAELRDFAGGAAPLLLVRNLLKTAGQRDRREEECRCARELAHALKDRDREMLKHLRSQKAPKKIVDEFKSLLDADRAKREELGKTHTVLNITPEARSDLHTFLHGDLDKFNAKTKSLLSQQSGRRTDERHSRVEYESIPSSDTVENILQERDELRFKIGKAESIYAALGQEIERSEREMERREAALTRLLEANANDRGRRDDRSRVLRHSNKVRKTLESFRQAVIVRHVHRIEQLVLESYRKLLRKNGLVTKLSINPEDYSLTLFDRNGEPLSAERLSAGERQLLAIALLWGLGKASGRPLPTAIDTPLGRLDSVHRMHLIERYLPFASHQILLLSTDEEISGEYHKRLSPWVGHTYQLNHDDKIGTTRIAAGYFASKEAA